MGKTVDPGGTASICQRRRAVQDRSAMMPVSGHHTGPAASINSPPMILMYFIFDQSMNFKPFCVSQQINLTIG